TTATGKIQKFVLHERARALEWSVVSSQTAARLGDYRPLIPFPARSARAPSPAALRAGYSTNDVGESRGGRARCRAQARCPEPGLHAWALEGFPTGFAVVNVRAPLGHSMTSSARASSVAGTSMPSVFAVLRLMTISYFVGACTGRSAGFSPLRMRST